MKKIFAGSVRIGKELINVFLACGSGIEAERFFTKQEFKGEEVTDPEFIELNIKYEECLLDIKRVLEQLGYHNGENFFKKQ